MSATFVVTLDALELPPTMEVAKALAKAHKTPVLDQTAFAKRAWGILAEHLAENEARALQQELKIAGLSCRLIKEDEFIAIPPATAMVRREAFDPGHLVVIGAAAIPFTTTTTTHVKEGPTAGQQVVNAAVLMSTGLPLHLGGKKRVIEKTTTHSDRLFYMDLILRDPWERYRIDAAQFDYACLNERKGMQSFANFRLLVDDFTREAPAARRNHGVQVLQNKRPILEMDYAALADYERELRWRLSL